MTRDLVVFCVVLVISSAAELTHFNLGNLVVPYRRQASDEFVSFSAGLTANANIVANSTVAFQRIFINTGNGYDNSTGVFSCPFSGVYVFLYHGLSESAGTLYLDLYKNDEYQVTGYAHNNNDYASASNAILLELKESDQVYIQAHGSSQLYGRTDEVYATFSGFILIPQGTGNGIIGK